MTDDAVDLTGRSRRRPPGFLGATAFYVLLVVIALFLIFGLLGPGHTFLTLQNFFQIGLSSAGLLLLAVGLTFSLAAGELDLSLGANLVLSSVVGAKVIALVGGASGGAVGEFTNLPLAITTGVLAAIATGTLMGLLNGLAVTGLKVNAFIVTLGSTGVATGISNVITNGSNVANLPFQLQTEFGIKSFFGVPLPFIVAVVLAIIGWLYLRQASFGRHVLAVGSSMNGARRSGVKVDMVRVQIFVLSGALAGVAGVIDLTKFGTTALSGHETDTLQALSAVIIGGTSLFGGRASMGGSIVAVFIPITLLSGFVVLGVPPFYSYIAIGLILIGAVYLDRVRRRRT